MTMDDLVDASLVPERVIAELPKRRDEGIGVFRGLISTALLYAAVGLFAWFIWFVVSRWPGHQ